MNVMNYEPWSLLDNLRRDLGQLDQIAARRFGYSGNGESSEQSVADWVPAVDIVEEKDRFILRADLPGVSAEDIVISMDKGVLSISGERRQVSGEQAEGRLQRVERATGKFYRRFSLPETVDGDRISAKSVNGILEVSIPKQPEVQARRINVEAA
jgi:HSP20 family protein